MAYDGLGRPPAPPNWDTTLNLVPEVQAHILAAAVVAEIAPLQTVLDTARLMFEAGRRYGEQKMLESFVGDEFWPHGKPDMAAISPAAAAQLSPQ